MLRGWGQNDGEDENEDQIEMEGEGNEEPENKREKALKALKKASVAVTGTALVAVGLPLIPMPTPGGVVVCGSGLAVLATEFPAAQRVLDKGRDGLERMVGQEEDDSDSDSDDDNGKTQKGYSKLNSQQMEDEDGEPKQLNQNEDTGLINNRNNVHVHRNKTAEERVDELKRNARKTGKRTKKNLKKFVRGTVLPFMSNFTSDKDGDGTSRVQRRKVMVLKVIISPPVPRKK